MLIGLGIVYAAGFVFWETPVIAHAMEGDGNLIPGTLFALTWPISVPLALREMGKG